MTADAPLFPRLPRSGRCDASVLLLSMPWGSADRPSISLAVLKSSLQRHGISVDIHNPYLTFAARIGFDLYARIETLQRLGEWLFSPQVFPKEEFGPGGRQDFLSFLLQRRGPDKDNYLPFLEGAGGDDEPPESFLGPDFRDHLTRIESEIPRFLEETLQWVLEHPAPVIGFTSTFAQILPSAALARRIKEVRPESVLVLGGASFDGEMGAAYHQAFPWIDYIATGEADDSFPSLVRRVLSGERPRILPGFSSSDGKTVLANLPAPPHHFTDDAPPIDFEEYFEETKFLTENTGVRIPLRFLPFEIARGCWWGERSHCTFCGLNDHTLKFRAKPSSRVLRELFHLVRKHRFAHFMLTDDILDIAQMEAIAPALKEADFQASYYIQTKADLTREQFRLLSELGVTRLRLGIESLHTPLLKRMAKGTTRLQNIQALKWSREFNIRVCWPFLWGIPGETEDDYQAMIDLLPSLLHLDSPEQLLKIEVHRFSPYHQNPAAHGLRNLRPGPEYGLCYPPGRVDHPRIAYRFDFEGDRILTNDSPAIRRFRSLLILWRTLDHNGKSSLSWTRGPGYIQVRDARSPGPGRIVNLHGTAGDLYVYCDQVRSLRAITELASRETGRSVPSEKVESLLQSMVDLRILIREENQFLSLALSGNRFPPGCLTDLSRSVDLRLEVPETVPTPPREPAPLPG